MTTKIRLPAVRRIGRRAFVRGASTGLCLALPMLELLGSRDVSAAGPLDKLVLFHFPNGAHPMDWSHLPTGPLPAETLPPMLEPLAGHWNGLTMLSGLSSVAAAQDYECSSGTPHALPTISCLTGAGLACTTSNTTTNRSVDHAAAELLPPAQIPSLYVRPYGSGFNLSFPTAGPGSVSQAPIRQPHVLFGQLFADSAMTPEELERLLARRVSVLDVLGQELADLRSSVGAADRRRLEFHADAVRQLEQRAELGLAACTPPANAPAEEPADPPDAELPARADALMDLSVMALRCGLTNVLLYSVGMSQGTPIYSFLEAGTPPHDAHQTSHMQAGETTEERRFWWQETNRYHMSKLARLLDLLSGADGGEPILDRAAVVALSEMGYGADHSPYNLPCLVGGAGLQGGRHVHYPCTVIDPSYSSWADGGSSMFCEDGGGQTALASLWLTMLQALGGEADSFGEASTTLDELW
jgi:hypothetical protein